MSLRLASVVLAIVAGVAAVLAMELTVRWVAPKPLQRIQLDDGHLNALGHRIVGETLAESLLPRLR